jgi:hypothetical protein
MPVSTWRAGWAAIPPSITPATWRSPRPRVAAVAMLSIPQSAIDQNRARGLGDREGQEKEGGKGPSGYSVLIRCRPLVVFAVCAMLFHFANAPLLPHRQHGEAHQQDRLAPDAVRRALVGQKLAQAYPKWATTMMSSCIIAAQLIMLPVALAVGRAVLYTLSDSAPWLIGGGRDTIAAGPRTNEIQGTLGELDGTTALNFHDGDSLDFTDLASPGATAAFSAGVLTVCDRGVVAARVQFPDLPTDASFSPKPDGRGGCSVSLITVPAPARAVAAQPAR